MIISASRRTDIPRFYSEWLINRINEKSVCVRNPMNFHQVSKITLSPDVIDGIVFWTKNPSPMLEKLSLLKDYTYYFQFTITAYENDIEVNLPSKKDDIIPAFQRLSNIIGADRVIWRYDPIFISSKYSLDFHVQAFEKLARILHNYTNKCTFSFLDAEYKGVKNNIRCLDINEFTAISQIKLSKDLASIAHCYGLQLDTCAEGIDLSEFGIQHARCIDNRLFEKLTNSKLIIEKDRNQRLECGCVSSIDIGMYNTCLNGCIYCYANYDKNIVHKNTKKHNPLSPLISGELIDGDIIKEKEVKSCRDCQIQIFDL